jgi:hypothetical protein
VTDLPADGEVYAVGDLLASGAMVVSIDAGGAGVHADPLSAWTHYQAFAYDTSLNYSLPSNPDDLYTQLAAQTATLEIDVSDPANPLVSVTSAPATFGLAARVGLRPNTAVLNAYTEGELVVQAVSGGTLEGNLALGLTDAGDGASISVAVTDGSVSVEYDRETHTAGEIADAVNADGVASALISVAAPVDGVAVDSRSATLTGGSDTDLRVWLELTNDNPRAVFNPKAVVQSTSAGTATGRWDIDGAALAYFGPAGIVPGETRTAWFDLEGALTAGGVISVELELQEHPLVVVSGGWDKSFVAADPAQSSEGYEISSESTGYGGFDQDSRHRDGFIAPRGDRMFLGNHNMPTVLGIDLTTLKPVVEIDLDDGTGVGHVDSVVLSPDGGHMYAVVTYGAHAAAWQDPGATGDHISAGEGAPAAETVELVKISMRDLTEVSRLTLVSESTLGARGRRLSQSADGSVGALAALREGLVFVLDLDAMTVTQTVDTSSHNRMPQMVAVSADGSTTAISFKDYQHPADAVEEVSDGTLWMVDNATGTPTPLAPPTLSEGTKPGFLEYGPDGRLYWGRKDVTDGGAVSIYDPSAASWVEIADFASGSGIDFTVDGRFAFIYDRNAGSVAVVELSTDTVVTMEIVNNAGIGHKTLATPWHPW